MFAASLGCFGGVAFSARIARMFIGRRAAAIPFAFLSAVVFASETAVPQSPPAASGARILLLPRSIVWGERATLAVREVDGRLAPGVTLNFSHGDGRKPDAAGR